MREILYSILATPFVILFVTFLVVLSLKLVNRVLKPKCVVLPAKKLVPISIDDNTTDAYFKRRLDEIRNMSTPNSRFIPKDPTP